MAIYRIEFIDRCFGSNDTIEAVIRNCNKDERINGGLLQLLMKNFNDANKNVVPSMGTQYRIPVVKR